MVSSWRAVGCLSALLCFLQPGRAAASVDLQLQGPGTPVVAGTTFQVDLVALANPGPSEPVGEINVVFSWDITKAFFQGDFVKGAVWQQAGFSAEPDGLNTDLTDGLVYYRTSTALLANPDTVGLVVATFEFTALVPTTLDPKSPAFTALSILASAGATPTFTRVLDDIGGVDVTGALLGGTVEIIACFDLFDCDDSNSCTTQSCVGSPGLKVCEYTPTYIVGEECCNPLGGATDGIDDQNECTSDFCDEATGIVTHEPVPQGVLCGEPDNLPCSRQDKCDAVGVCQPNHNPDGWFCDTFGDECTTDWCQNGVCAVKTTEDDGFPCDDGFDFCTPGQDTCLGGECFSSADPCSGTPSTPFCVEYAGEAACVVCRVGEDDCPSNGCLRGSCCPGALPFCLGPPSNVSCVTFVDDDLCLDSDFCNGLETCNSLDGTCLPDPDPNQCINPDFPHCEESTDSCQECLEAAHCQNGVACDGTESCNTAGALNLCENGVDIDCSGLNDDCNDGQCQEPSGSCVAVPTNEGQLGCTDNDGCTLNDRCQDGTCVGGPTTGIGGVSLELRLPAGAPTSYLFGEDVEVDLMAVLNNSITTCSQSAIACQDSGDCPAGETCITATAHQLLFIEAVLDWDDAVFEPVLVWDPVFELFRPATLEPCNKCDGCSVSCIDDTYCVDTPGVPDCLCDVNGGPPPCPPPPFSGAHCRQALIGFPDSCPGSPSVPPCSPNCPAGQYDWASVTFPTTHELNASYTDGDAFVTVTEPLVSNPAVVTSTQDLWVARLTFTVVGGSGAGGPSIIGFTECTGDPAGNPTLTRVQGTFDPITGDLTGVEITAGGCADADCDDGQACNGTETCASTTPGDCLPGVDLCEDTDACTSNDCTEPGNCSFPPNYNPATQCCNPGTGDTMTIDDQNQCTDDVCDPVTGVVTHTPLDPTTTCDDGDACTENDHCNGAGACIGETIPGCRTCINDTQCDDLVACTVDTCIDGFGLPCLGQAGCSCLNTPDDSLCLDNGVYCDGEEICDQFSGCVGAGLPCPGCQEQSTPHCPCEAPGLMPGGPRYLAIRPKPIDSNEPVKLRVTSADFPCLSKYVGSMLCGATDRACSVDADCNGCSFTKFPCLVDTDCDWGRCTSGQECSVQDQNCVDQSLCIRSENCVVSGDLCTAAPLKLIDINLDGLDDGTLAVLVDDPADAAELTPAEWSGGVMRCGKSAAPCAIDDNCPRGYCSLLPNAFCNVFAQDCSEGAGTCIRNEKCLTGAVYVFGTDIRPSDFDQSSGTFIPTRYAVSAECSITIPPVETTMWRWADVGNDSYVSVTDIFLLILAIQGQYEFSSVINDDLAGLGPCLPQQILNVTDTLMAIRAVQGELFSNIQCPSPCP